MAVRGLAPRSPRSPRSPRLLDLPEVDSKRRIVQDMFDRIAWRYDLLNSVLTFGLDRYWRRAALRAAHIEPGDVVLDLAAGTGELCRLAMKRGAVLLGVDLSAGMLAVARRRADCALIQADAEALPIPDGSVDAVTCGFALRNFVALEPVLAEAARVLRPGGRLVLLDVAGPRNAFVAAGHAAYFRHVVPLIGALVSDREAYAYLPASVAYLPAPARLVCLVREAHFDEVERRTMTGGIVQVITGSRA